MESATLMSQVCEIIRQSLGLKQVSEDAALGRTPKWDSLNHIKIILGIEKAFQLKVGTENVATLVSAKAIADFLKGHAA